ncbi:hypothetical protein CMI43_02800 [Candidatus Pacearchaeota archaeon]|nr:hypothetical protein [Candidatus Pacearchaeota archaeon]|tara:strand:+ start:5651 stop:6241 length:591 start_codon:yes stop_codon:yes gene_type:complete
MKFRLILLVLLFSVSLVSAQYHYEFDLSFTGKEVRVDSVGIKFNHREVRNFELFEENYQLKIFDGNNKELLSDSFGLPSLSIFEGIEGEELGNGGRVVEENGSFSLIFPYYENAHSAVVYYNGIESDRILLSQYSKQGFNIEDFKGDELVIEEDKREEIIKKDFEYADNNNLLTGILWIVLIALSAFLYFLLKKKK